MGILNYSTGISAERTAAEVQAILGKHGAASVSVIYTDGQPTGLAFAITTPYGLRDFQLPANAAGVQAVMLQQVKAKTLPANAKTRDPLQPNRVAWRILKDWVEAQLAIIQAGMVTMDEVMLPYLITPSGQTLAAAYRDSAMRAAIEGASDGQQPP